MDYQALARKWRPTSFDTMVGQSHVLPALIHALEQQRLHHAYLFTGTRGVGKTSLARIFAKCLNCETGITAHPCQTCRTCRDIDRGCFIDLIEVDAASRTKVEDTRELLDNVPYAPSQGRFKVYLIDEVHMLSSHSFNALLKTLEEPPPHVKFLLATTDPEKLPVTVLSRCLQCHLRPLTDNDITQQLTTILKDESISFDDAALACLSEQAHGSLRDALSLLDQTITLCNGHISEATIRQLLGIPEESIIHQLLDALLVKDAHALMALSNHIHTQGISYDAVLERWIEALHRIGVNQFVANHTPALQRFAEQWDKETVQLYYQIALLGKRDLPLAPTERCAFEMTALRLLAFELPASDTHRKEKTTPLRTVSAPSPAAITAPLADTSQATTWNDIVPQLTVSGMTQALATHCALESLHEATLTLLLEHRHQAMLTDNTKKRLSDALNTYFNKPMTMNIKLTDHKTASPQQLHTENDKRAHTQATQHMQSDKHLQSLLDTFRATLKPDSIQSVKINDGNK